MFDNDYISKKEFLIHEIIFGRMGIDDLFFKFQVILLTKFEGKVSRGCNKKISQFMVNLLIVVYIYRDIKCPVAQHDILDL